MSTTEVLTRGSLAAPAPVRHRPEAPAVAPAPRHRAPRDTDPQHTAPKHTAPRHTGKQRPSRPPRSSRLRRLGSLATTMMLVLAVVAFLTLALGPHVFGYRTATMLTGSMSPQINPGDVIVSVPKPAEDVRVGDVITYHIPVEDHRVETHRVVKVSNGEDGSIAVRTKGDANEGVDPWTATLEGDTVWELQGVVPYAGSVIRALRAPLIQGFAFWGALGGFVLLALVRIWRRSEDDGPDPTAEAEVDEHKKEAQMDRSRHVLDLRALENLAEEMESLSVAVHFAEKYAGLLPSRVARIHDTLDSGDLHRALDAVLSLKVTSTTVGAYELEQLAAAIEVRVRAHDLEGARSLAAGLGEPADRTSRALGDYLVGSGGSIR